MLAPDPIDAGKQIDCSAAWGTVIRLMPVDPSGRPALAQGRYCQRVADERNAKSEYVASLGIGCFDIGLLTPHASRAREDINRSAAWGTVICLIPIAAG